jgi:Domain of Unknown Function (DUF928)
VLEVLAPEHVGLTLSPQPSLYWYVSGPVKQTVDLTLIGEQDIYPLLEAQLASPKGAGIYRIDLKKMGARLEKDRHYWWYVAIVMDPQHRSKDILARGAIVYRDAPQLAVKTTDLHSAWDRASAFGSVGVWYDMIEELSRFIATTPNDAVAKSQRAELLRDAGISGAAAFDERTSKQ